MKIVGIIILILIIAWLIYEVKKAPCINDDDMEL